MLINNPKNIFLINPNILCVYFPFIKHLLISKILLVSTELKSEKNFTIPFNHGFFILLIVKSFEILPKHI